LSASRIATRAHSGNVETLAQQVDADQHVERAQPEVADDLDALQRVDVGMQVAAADAGLVHVLDQVLGHALGQHGDQHTLALLGAVAAFGDQVVDLLLDRADDHRRVDEAGRPDDLLDEGALGALHLPRPGRGADECRLRPQRFPLLELERPVVDGRGQAEAELGQDALAVEVAAEHAADLRHRDVALVDDQQRIFGEILEQRGRRLARLAAGEIARIVLDAGAGACGLQHLDIEQRALLEPLRLEQPAGAVESHRAAA
jgi:hypothetical protein